LKKKIISIINKLTQTISNINFHRNLQQNKLRNFAQLEGICSQVALEQVTA